ncbi:MAG: hypothetical protein ACE5EU_15140 [Paracoccaceae bacterium]
MRKILTAIAVVAGLAGAVAYAHEADTARPGEGGMMNQPGMMGQGGMMGMMAQMNQMMETCNKMMAAMMDKHGDGETPEPDSEG